LSLALFLPWPVAAEIRIPTNQRIHNRPPGRCGWCALETLARHHKIKALYGLTRKHASTADTEDLERALRKAHVRYRIQYPGKRNTRILRSAIQSGRGAAVGFRPRVRGGNGHIVTLVDFGARQVRIIDPSHPRHVRTLPQKRFMSYWDGLAIVLETKPARTAKRSGRKP
jgi:hypothetical protein